MREELQITVSLPIDKQKIQIISAWDLVKNKRVSAFRYQSQTFCFLNVFPLSQAKEVSFIWWNLTNTLGKTYLLLKGSKSYSIWEQVASEQVVDDSALPWKAPDTVSPTLVRAGLMMMQATYAEIDFFFGSRHAELFEQEITDLFRAENFPQTDSLSAVQQLFKADPWIVAYMVSWQRRHLDTLLQEVYRLAAKLFGNNTFVPRVLATLDELPSQDHHKFKTWLTGEATASRLWKYPTDASINHPSGSNTHD
ncbi:MAG TPA: hypothetical protein V6C78_28825 [Crinalium sp.]|jgi:hypothetical protein